MQRNSRVVLFVLSLIGMYIGKHIWVKTPQSAAELIAERDWSAGVLACNVAFFSDVKLLRSQVARAFRARTHAGRDACAPIAPGCPMDAFTIEGRVKLE